MSGYVDLDDEAHDLCSAALDRLREENAGLRAEVENLRYLKTKEREAWAGAERAANARRARVAELEKALADAINFYVSCLHYPHGHPEVDNLRAVLSGSPVPATSVAEDKK